MVVARYGSKAKIVPSHTQARRSPPAGDLSLVKQNSKWECYERVSLHRLLPLFLCAKLQAGGPGI